MSTHENTKPEEAPLEPGGMHAEAHAIKDHGLPGPIAPTAIKDHGLPGGSATPKAIKDSGL